MNNVESIEKDTLDNFTQVTGFDVSAYLSLFRNFMLNDFNTITSFFRGEGKFNKNAFTNLDNLVLQTNNLHDLINIHAGAFKSYDYWILLDKLSDIRLSVNSTVNISKFLRSSVTRGNYGKNATVDYTLSQGQTLESVSRNVLGDSNPGSDWVNIAVSNDVKEEDYTPDSGLAVKIKSSGVVSFNVQSVFDNLTSENVYGKDIARKITFNQSEQDLNYLDYGDTLMQSVEILANMRQNNNPRYPADGVVKDMVVGQPMSVVTLPTVIRQMQSVFATDDTIKTMVVNDIKKDGDTLELVYEVHTVLDKNVDGLTTRI